MCSNERDFESHLREAMNRAHVKGFWKGITAAIIWGLIILFVAFIAVVIWG